MVMCFIVFGFCATMVWCCCCDSGSITLRGITPGVALLNIPDSVLIYSVWESTSVTSGLDDDGLRRKYFKY